jgi:F0F1-type ATP synthase delta subunit
VDAFRKLLGAEPTLVARINPAVLAGFVVRVGDRVYDASARSGLERLGKQMLDRAVEAIQANPNRFLEGAPGA